MLGHTEDALEDVLNHFYIISAHIIPDGPKGKWKTGEEKFTSLCYAGHLPGYTMGYNHHGFIFSVNTLCANKLLPGKIRKLYGWVSINRNNRLFYLFKIEKGITGYMYEFGPHVKCV